MVLLHFLCDLRSYWYDHQFLINHQSKYDQKWRKYRGGGFYFLTIGGKGLKVQWAHCKYNYIICGFKWTYVRVVWSNYVIGQGASQWNKCHSYDFPVFGPFSWFTVPFGQSWSSEGWNWFLITGWQQLNLDS